MFEKHLFLVLLSVSAAGNAQDATQVPSSPAAVSSPHQIKKEGTRDEHLQCIDRAYEDRGRDFLSVFFAARKNKDMHHEAIIEHDGAKKLIGEIQASDPSDDYYDSKVHVLSEMLKHHVK